MPLFGPPDIDKLVKKNDYPGLIFATRYRRDPAIRIHALEALAEKRIYQSLDIKNFTSIIASVTQVLSVSAKTDPDPDVKRTALRGLTKLHSVSSGKTSEGGRLQVTELASLLSHYVVTGDDTLASDAAVELSSFQNLRRLLPASTQLSKDLASWLARQISQGKLGVALPIIGLLVKLGEEKTVATILKQYPPSTRLDFLSHLIQAQPASAARIAASIGYREVVPLLLQHLDHKNPEIATALAALNATEAIEPLLAILPVGGDAEKYKAEIDALSQLGDASLVKILLDRIEQHPNAFHGIEIAVFAGLGRRELGWLTDALIRAASQREWGILMEAFGILNDKSTVPIILDQANRYPMAEILPQVMGEFHDDRFAPFLVSFMSNPKAPGRQRAARALGFLSDSQIVPALIQAVHKKDKSLVDFAIEALEQQYKNKSLSDADKQLIIQTASQLKQQHKDSHSHGDEGFKGAISDCTHTDYQLHHDQGALIKI
jgi:HEAT repeat protein